MIYCKECRKKRDWPILQLTLEVRICEVCKRVKDCYDVPNHRLPPLPSRMIFIEGLGSMKIAFGSSQVHFTTEGQYKTEADREFDNSVYFHGDENWVDMSNEDIAQMVVACMGQEVIAEDKATVSVPRRAMVTDPHERPRDRMNRYIASGLSLQAFSLRERLEQLSEMALRMEDMMSDIGKLDPDDTTSELKVEVEALVARIQELL